MVVLASVVGAFVFDAAGGNEEPAPQASLLIEVDAADDKIGLEHQADDQLSSDRTRIVWEINGSTCRSSPPDNGTIMKASDQVVFTFNGSSGSTGTWTNYSSPGNQDIESDHVITVILYDTESGDRVYTETVTASEVRADL